MTRASTLAVVVLLAGSLGVVPAAVEAPSAEPPLEEACAVPALQDRPDDGVATPPPDVSVSVYPEEDRVQLGTTTTFTFCVVNGSNRTVSHLIRVWHSGDRSEDMYLVGPHYCSGTDNSVGVRPIGPSESVDCPGTIENEAGEEGMAIYSSDDGLQPGDVAHYTVVANVSQTGTYDVLVEYVHKDRPRVKQAVMGRDSATVTVHCSPACWITRNLNLALGVAGLVIGVVSLTAGSETVRNGLRHAGTRTYEVIRRRA